MANVPVTAWDEAAPAGVQNASLGDNRMREMKTQIREVIEVDHDMPSDANDPTVGQHTSLHLQEAADIGDGAAGLPVLGAETLDEPELTWKSEDDETVRFTDEGQQFTVVPNYAADPAAPVIGQLWVRNDL